MDFLRDILQRIGFKNNTPIGKFKVVNGVRVIEPKIRNPKLLDEAKKALDRCPIPTPWGFPGYSGFKLSDGRKLTWHEKTKPITYGSTLDNKIRESTIREYIYLADDKDNIYFKLKFHVYPYCLTGNELLLVYTTKADIHLDLFKVEELKPISLNSEFDKISEDKSANVIYESQPKASIKIPKIIAINENKVEFPESMKSISEIFVVEERSIERKWNEPEYALYHIQPQKDIVEVKMLDWFNKGGFDFGYQWIRRVVRLPGTDKLVGDGVRMGVFIMNSDGKLIKYLYEYAFYM